MPPFALRSKLLPSSTSFAIAVFLVVPSLCPSPRLSLRPFLPLRLVLPPLRGPPSRAPSPFRFLLVRSNGSFKHEFANFRDSTRSPGPCSAFTLFLPLPFLEPSSTGLGRNYASNLEARLNDIWAKAVGKECLYRAVPRDPYSLRRVRCTRSHRTGITETRRSGWFGFYLSFQRIKAGTTSMVDLANRRSQDGIESTTKKRLWTGSRIYGIELEILRASNCYKYRVNARFIKWRHLTARTAILVSHERSSPSSNAQLFARWQKRAFIQKRLWSCTFSAWNSVDSGGVLFRTRRIPPGVSNAFLRVSVKVGRSIRRRTKTLELSRVPSERVSSGGRGIEISKRDPRRIATLMPNGTRESNNSGELEFLYCASETLLPSSLSKNRKQSECF